MYNARIQHRGTRQSSVYPRTLISLMILLLTRAKAAFVAKPWRLDSTRTTTPLKNKSTHSEYNDFASYDTTDQEEEAQRLAKEFYKELEHRQAAKFSTRNSELDDRNDVLRSRPSGSDGGGSKVLFSSPPRSIKNPGPSIAFFPSFFHPQPPPPPASAGLFSGRGHTAYSSGRSIHAEIQLLDSSLNKGDDTQKSGGWNAVFVSNHTDQFEQLLKLAAGTLIVLSATYLTIEVAGELAFVFPWEEAVFDPLVDGIVKDGISRVLVVLGDGVEHVGTVIIEDAAWFVGESSALAGSVGQAVARSMEGLVLR